MLQPEYSNNKNPRNILLRSGWQSENIGYIGHTPAALALIEKYIPDAIVTFWPYYHYLPDDELQMLQKRFPKMELVQGKLDAQAKASTKELEEAIKSADFFLHNSGPVTVAWADAAAFKRITASPLVCMVLAKQEMKTLSDAAFVYFRDSISLQKAKDDGVHPPIMKFSPDVAFATDVTDDKAALALLQSNGLVEGKFLCCVPRHRLTPVWLHSHKNRPFDAARNERNEAMKEHDHKPLRDAITTIVRNTNHKILICNEDEVQVAIGKEWLYDKLPEDVKLKVVWMNRHWLTDEAVSVYKRSAGLFGKRNAQPYYVHWQWHTCNCLQVGRTKHKGHNVA